MPISIAIVDDHRVVGRSLQAYLESFPDLKLVRIATTGEELLQRLDEWRPQVVLRDLLLPGGIDGIETTQRVLARAPEVRVVALTASTDEARMMGVLRAGASGYVRKDAEPETLLAAVRAVARGRTFIDPSIGHRVLRTDISDDLTPRELDVLRQLALGKSNKDIAVALDIAKRPSRHTSGTCSPSSAPRTVRRRPCGRLPVVWWSLKTSPASDRRVELATTGEVRNLPGSP